MPTDALTNDGIAKMIEDAHARSRIVNGVKHTTITTDALTLVLRELLAARAACDLAYHHLDAYGYRGHERQIASQDAVFNALRPFASFAGRL